MYKLGMQIKPLPPHTPKMGVSPLVTPPKTLIRSTPFIGMYENDKLEDCTSSALANLMNAICHLEGWRPNIDTQNVIDFYSQTTGYTPENPLTDEGGDPVDVLRQATSDGFKGVVDTYYPLWGLLDSHLWVLANAMHLLGGVYLGVNLSESDYHALKDHQVLDIDQSSYGNTQAGSWGGHVLVAYSYDFFLGDKNIVTLLSWGREIRATWRWIKDRYVVAYGLIFPNLRNTKGKNFEGLDLIQLEKDLAHFLR